MDRRSPFRELRRASVSGPVLAAFLAALVAAFLALPPTAQAQRIVADLSSREIAITTGFAGAELLLFGATEGSGDIVVTVEGPQRPEIVRRKERVAGIWVNGSSVDFERVPSYYWVASSRRLADIAPPALLASMRIGADRLPLTAKSERPAAEVARFRDAFIRNKEALGLYGSGEAEIGVIGGRLFRTSIPFPANVPTGEYNVTVHLFKDGRLVSRERTPLEVNRTGLEAQIFDFAHNHAPWYGAFAILVALMAGWLAGVIFRRG